MGLFEKRNNTKQENPVSVWLHLNARLQPVHREEIFEDLLEQVLSKYKLGELLGGGTLQKATGEVKSCAIEMMIQRDKLEKFFSVLYQIDTIPKGSRLIIDDEEKEIGSAEGLALYLNGTDLPAEIYENCDINYLIDQLDLALEESAFGFSYWEGNSETALYYYGRSYEEMVEKITPIVEKYPLCAKCRIEQVV